MSFLAPAMGGPLAYRGPRSIDARQRVLAIGAVAALHALVIGGLVSAQLKTPKPPPEPTLTVSLITENAAPAPSPPQPPQPTPPPERQMIATPRPTPSPMTAPPMEKETPREVVVATPAPPAPPAPASPALSAPPGPPITPPSIAAYLNNPRPVYPVASRRRREEGAVRLRVQVGPDGAPQQVLLAKTSGHPDLDNAALDVVKRRWKFVAAKQADRAVSAWVVFDLDFDLNSR